MRVDFTYLQKKKKKNRNPKRSVNSDDIASFKPTLLRFGAGAASPVPAAGPAGVGGMNVSQPVRSPAELEPLERGLGDTEPIFFGFIFCQHSRGRFSKI